MNYTTDTFNEWKNKVKAGDKIELSGTVFTARDAAHKRIFELIRSGLPLPFDISGKFLYYAGPTPAKGGLAIGSCGPTTSSRMDQYTPYLMKIGLSGTIGKGERNAEVVNAIKAFGGIYLCAVGGAGALAAKSIESAEVIAFDDLGCESVKKLQFRNFPLYVGIDMFGNSIFKSKQNNPEYINK